MPADLAALLAELRAVEARIDAAYWSFTRCARAKPPVLVVPDAYRRRKQLKTEIARLREERAREESEMDQSKPHACDALDCQQPQCLERAHELQPSMINPAIENWTEYRDDTGAWQPVPALPSDVERPCGCRGTCASQRRDGRAVVHELWGLKGETWYLELTADKKGPTETRVYDCDWDHVFTLPGHCSPGLVFAVYGIQEEALARGKRVGERAARVAICNALGATSREE